MCVSLLKRQPLISRVAAERRCKDIIAIQTNIQTTYDHDPYFRHTQESDSNIHSVNEQSTDICYQSTQYLLSSFVTSNFDMFHNALTEDCSDTRHIAHTHIRDHKSAARIASVALPLLPSIGAPSAEVHPKTIVARTCRHELSSANICAW